MINDVIKIYYKKINRITTERAKYKNLMTNHTSYMIPFLTYGH